MQYLITGKTEDSAKFCETTERLALQLLCPEGPADKVQRRFGVEVHGQIDAQRDQALQPVDCTSALVLRPLSDDVDYGDEMITFPNGYRLDFCCASGALEFDGRGWPWEQPLRWLRILRPCAFTIITKTLTYEPLEGNLDLWRPWECVALIPDGAVNAVGLTNPGFKHWVKNIYPVARRQGKIIVSIGPYDAIQARWMAVALNKLRDIVGIEVNLSCPNVDHVHDPVAIMEAVRSNTDHNVIAKVGIDQLEVCQKIEPMVDAFDAINSIKWSILFKTPSPLARYGLEGGVSGGPIREHARHAANYIRRNTNKPVISGGGVGSVEEVYARHVIGAGAVSLGTQAFLREPWMANLIVDVCRSEMGVKDERPGQRHRVAKEVYATLTRRLPSLLEGWRGLVSGVLGSSRR